MRVRRLLLSLVVAIVPAAVAWADEVPFGLHWGDQLDYLSTKEVIGQVQKDDGKSLLVVARNLRPLPAETDSVLMVGAYGWAFVKPMRKLYYNLTITFASIVVALLVGGVEALGLAVDKLGLTGPFWTFIAGLNENFGSLGYVVIGIFVLSWLGSMMVYRVKRFGELEAHR